MRCFHPITMTREVENALGHKHKRTYTFPCGKCLACLRRYANEWAFRAMCEAETSKAVHFLTLTYEDENLPLSVLDRPTLRFDDVDKWLKRFRHLVPPLRYFMCGEYGDKFGRPHYHLISYFPEDVTQDFLESALAESWPFGHAHVDPYVGAPQAKYVAKYLLKKKMLDYRDCEPAQARMSRMPGLGRQWCKDNIEVLRKIRDNRQLVIHDYQGTPYPIPRFIKKFCYSDQDRERLSLYWQQQFDDSTEASRYNRHQRDQYSKLATFDLEYKMHEGIEDHYKRQLRRDPNNHFPIKKEKEYQRYNHSIGLMECSFEDLYDQFENELFYDSFNWHYDEQRQIYVNT